MPSPARLKQRRQFLVTQEKGVKKVGKAFVLYYLVSETQIAVGYTATKKTLKHAVDRNRAKRRLRAAVQQLAHQGTLPTTGQMVLVARRAILDANFQSLTHDLQQALEGATCGNAC